jgi:hypothetical protein
VSRRRSPAGPAAVVALVAAAIVLALLARDVRAWPRALQSSDIRAAAGESASWHPSTFLPVSWSQALTGLGPDRRLRLAIERFRQSYALQPGADNALAQAKRRAAAEAALAAAANDSDPVRASQALDLLGLLLFGDASAGAGSSVGANALGDLQQAVRLDDGNADAKANLELVLRLLAGSGSRAGSAASSGPRGTGRRGAGSGAAGEGY